MPLTRLGALAEQSQDTEPYPWAHIPTDSTSRCVASLPCRLAAVRCAAVTALQP